jgi:hypothetical protein
MMKIEIRIKKMPFAKPERVSIRPYLRKLLGSVSRDDGRTTDPYVNLSLGGHVAMIDANKPTPIAMQSNPM